MEMSVDEKRFLLECMKMAYDEGYYLKGHYLSKLTFAQIDDLARKLCAEAGLAVDERSWIGDYDDN